MRRAWKVGVASVALVACGGAPGAAPGGDADSHASSELSRSIADVTPAATVSGAAKVRALVELAVHDPAGLDATIASLYTPSSASFRAYLTRAQLLATYAPTASDVTTATTWLKSKGLTAARVSADNLFIEIEGTASAFDAAFGATIIPSTGTGTMAFAWNGTPKASGAAASIIVDVLAPDAPAKIGAAPVDTGTVRSTLPPYPTQSFLVSQIATAYGATAMYGKGITGKGATIGVAGAGASRASDRQTFWNGQKITRADATVVQVAEATTIFDVETTVDLEWSGGIAPGAGLVYYEAPDNHDGSLLYAVNEAVGNDAADVVSDSFSHYEEALPGDFLTAYDTIGRFAAAMGITLVTAAGDSTAVDAPAASPWFTAIGGTSLTLAANGSIASETAWDQSGCGASMYESAPAWQPASLIGAGGMRAVADISLHASSYFYRWAGAWSFDDGTSFSSPTTAGLIALVDASRLAAGKPRVGYLNSLLYATPALQAAFHDVTTGTAGSFTAAAGWDYPTGWGSTNAASLAAALP